MRVAGREVFWRTAGLVDCRAELDARDELDEFDERELNERALFCERVAAFSRVALRDCVAARESRVALLVLEREKLEPRVLFASNSRPRLEKSPGRAVAAVAGRP